MSFTIAPALVSLLAYANEKYPNRPKAADGTIGDASHAARKSEHNPNKDTKDKVPDGMVTARDIGCTKLQGNAMLKDIIKDHRTWYVIWDGFIYSRTHDFEKRKYDGHPHDKHLHVSLVQTAEACNDKSPWGPPKPKPVVKKLNVHIVKRGENLSSIAEKYDTTWQTLHKLNRDEIGTNPNVIQVGAVLKLP